MPTIAPWLKPVDVLGTIQAGTEAGMAGARLRQQAAESAARLGLSSASMAAEERRAAEALAERKMALEGLNAYHSGLLQLRGEAQDEQATRDKALGEYRSGMLDARNRQLDIAAKRGAIPRTANEISQYFSNDPVMQREEQQAMAKINAGMPVLQALNEHPTLMKNPPYSQRWTPLYRSEILKTQGGAGSAGGDLRKLLTERNALQGTLDKALDLPEGTQQATLARIKAIDAQIGGGQSAGAPPATAPDESAPAAQGLMQPPGDENSLIDEPQADNVPVFTDSSGKQYRYVGDSPDPMTDKNPDSWELAE